MKLKVFLKKLSFALVLIALAIVTTWAFHVTQQAGINYQQGHRLFEKGSYEAAIPYLRRAISEDPRHAQALSELASCYLWTGKPEEAVLMLERLLSLTPESYKAKKNLARAYSWSSEHGKAISLYREILIENPEDLDARRRLAEVNLWEKNLTESETQLLEVLSREPNNARAKYLYGKVLHYSGRTREAIKIFEELLKQDALEKNPGAGKA